MSVSLDKPASLDEIVSEPAPRISYVHPRRSAKPEVVEQNLAAHMVCVEVNRTTENGSWTGSTQLPIFYLSKYVQGIVSLEQAGRIVLDILGPGFTGYINVMDCADYSSRTYQADELT